MAKILGLDLGTNSIGWAVVNVKFENEKVVNYTSIDDSGVRIFPEGVEPTTIGQGDKEQSKNATRREHRQMRRQFYRKKLRKVKLLQSLIDLNMCPLSKEGLNQWYKWRKTQKSEGKNFPDEPDFLEWLKLNPYKLRTKALDEPITRIELGRIFYQFIQHRGFLSSRKGTDDGAIYKGKDNMSGINATRKLIGEETLGKKLYEISYKDGEKYKYKTDDEGNELRVRARYTQRDMYIAEFVRIWDTQAKNLGLNNEEVKVNKVRFLNGNISNNRNRKKIESYYNKYGKDNVVIKENRVTSYEYVSLKKFLAGDIDVVDDQLRFKSNNSLLFWQRPLRSQKGLLDNCRFERNIPVLMSNGEFRMKNGEIVRRSKKPCLLSHPEFELFRAYQLINNIRYGKGKRLTPEQRKVVIDLFNSKDVSFNFELIPKALNLTYEKFNFDNDQKVAGNTTIKRLKSLFPDEVWQTNYEKIWHCFYFYDDNNKLFEKLKKDFHLKKTYNAENISKIRLKEGYSNVSLKAIRNINPFLEKGYYYSDAVVLGGVKNAFGKQWEHFDVQDFIERLEYDIISILNEKDNKEGEVINSIKAYLSDSINSYGFRPDDPAFTQLYHHSQEVTVDQKEDLLPELENLRNPIVQQSLHEMRRLVNELLRSYRKSDPGFQFARIHVEMGRNLKNNKTKRQDLTRRIRDNEKRNEEARVRLAEYGIRPTRDNLLRYLLYSEIEKHISGPVLCPYTGKVISIADLFGEGNSVQIEHINPYSVSLDDSFGNKTLCEALFNNLKAEKTPYEFYLQNHDPNLWGINTYENIEDGWSEIAERAFKILPYPKARRFTSKKAYKKGDFIERQLNDSRYISRKAVELLSTICNDVRMLPGQLTSELRHLWGINNILNPIHEIENFKTDVREDERLLYYVATDEKDKVLNVQRKTNDRPNAGENQMVLSGDVNKEEFTSKYLSMKVDTPDLKNGRYWAIVKVSKPHSFKPVYANKPLGDVSHLVLKGRIEKGNFNNDTIGKRIYSTEKTDGAYWATFNVIGKELKLAEKKGKIKTTGSKVALFGEVKNGWFTCHVYECETDMPDGKYWALLELDFEDVTYTRSVNPKPEKKDENQLISYATVDENGNIITEADPEYQLSTNIDAGRYYCIFDIESVNDRIYPMENEAPNVEKNQRLTEAVVWVDKSTGEIKYDPKKNRDDHRHHAIDAITVALTEQGFLQRLSTYHAKEENEKRGLDNSEKFPEPWDGFANDVKKVANAILISHKQNNKVLSRISKTVTKNGEKHKSVGFAARGQLHKETVFGKRQSPKHSESYHIRKPITTLKDNKQIGKVVDDTIRILILDHLRDKCGVDTSKDKFSVPSDAFFKDGKPRLFLPNRKGGEPVPVKKVRMRENVGNAVQLKTNINQHVNPRNNHHVVIYEDFDGNLQEQVVSFIEVVERQKNGDPVYQLPKEDGKRIITTLEINDMFLLGMDDDVEICNKNAHMLNKHLYRVQKISSSYYTFRYHLASTLTNKNEEIYIVSFLAWKKYNPIKVKLDSLGKITRL